MDRSRLAELRELLESTADPADRADHETMMHAEFPGTWNAPPDDLCREASWQLLRAQIQLPDAAD